MKFLLRRFWRCEDEDVNTINQPFESRCVTCDVITSNRISICKQSVQHRDHIHHTISFIPQSILLFSWYRERHNVEQPSTTACYTYSVFNHVCANSVDHRFDFNWFCATTWKMCVFIHSINKYLNPLFFGLCFGICGCREFVVGCNGFETTYVK